MCWIGINAALAPYSLCVTDENGHVLRSLTADSKLFAAENLIDEITSLLISVGKSTSDLDWIAIVSGPGNYTGLRLSATTANFLAQIAGVQLIPIDTFEWIAGHVRGFSGTYLGVTPSVKGQINTQLFSIDSGKITLQSELVAMDIPEFDRFLSHFSVPFTVTGILNVDFFAALKGHSKIKFVSLDLDSRILISVAQDKMEKARSFVSPVYFHQAVRT